MVRLRYTDTRLIYKKFVDLLMTSLLSPVNIVGDPRQLPAYVASRAAEKAGLGKSLFERLEQAGHAVVMLSVQYR